MKKVYIAMIADFLHSGHINIINKASEYGEVTLGLMTDAAIDQMGDEAFLSYEDRLQVIEKIDNVSNIVSHETASYKSAIDKLHPDFIIHGDDWKTNKLKFVREEVIELLSKYGGQLIEVPYSSHINSAIVKDGLRNLGVVSNNRVSSLKNKLKLKKTLRFLESHNALSALIAEEAFVEKNKSVIRYDGFWSSSLTDSTAKGKPDIEAIDITSRLNVVSDIFEVTTKPLIFDADTGGKVEHFRFTVKSLERNGVSAVVIEDKTGLKKNSLLGNEVKQTQDTIENFCEKIKAGIESRLDPNFMIIARVESLILDAGIEDALLRANSYVKAGADGIMIHSRHKDPSEIKEFLEKFRAKDTNTPIIVVPTSFNTVHIEELEAWGVNIVIYANHMLRAAYPAMKNVAEEILLNGRTYESEDKCMSVKEILEFIPGTK